MHQPPVRFTYRLLSYLISTIIAGQPLLPAVGAVITPQNGAGMDKAANGVPVVNIATPNGAGISHNRFTDYNVGKEGLILNNATGKLNPTQLGGLIQNNPNLKAGGEAKGIINEVTGGNRSLLQGYTEVAGKAANVMVANPYGITCDGCGFINTPHATLTTGRPVMNADGSLQALEVTEGSITINGAGLDGTRSDAVSIIARATEVNAALHAKDLTVTAGANRITADGRVSALKGEGDVPKVAVDTGALGGMYARRIHLTSTESGVGVNLGNLYARDGDITLDASGRLTVNNSLATGAVTAKGQGVTLTGDHKAGGNLSVSSRSDIVLSNGTLNSDKDLSLTAGGRITQQNEKLTAGRDVTLAAKNITQDTASQINAARDIVTVASDTLTTQGQITAGQNLTASATTLTQDGILLAKGHAGLDAGTLNNSGAVQGASLTLGSTTLSNSGSLLSGGPLTVNTRDFTQSGRTGAKGKVDITASGKLTSTGSLVSDDVLVLKAQDVTQNGVLSGGKGLTVSAQALSSGKKSVTHSDAAMTLNVTTVALDGENSAGDTLRVQADKLSTAAGAQLQSGKNLSINARDARLAGTQAAQQTMAVNASEKLTHSGKSSAPSLSLSAPELTSSGVLVGFALNTQSQTLTNSGLLQGEASLTVNTQRLDNQQNGTLYSAADLTLDIPDIRNSGLITGDNGLTLNTASLSNPGKIIADTLNVRATTLDGDGLLQGAGALALAGDTLSQGRNGRWLTAGDLSLRGKTLHTAGTTQGQNLTVQADNWANSGSVLATGNLTASATGQLTSTGDIMSQGDTTLKAATTDNRGSLLSAGTLSLDGNSLDNSGTVQGNHVTIRQNSVTNSGTLTGIAALTLAARMASPQPALMNNGGSLLTSGDLTITAGSITSSGHWQGKRVLITADSLANSGAIQAADSLTARLTGELVSTAGSKVTSNGEMALSALNLSNSGQWIAKNLTLKANSLTSAGDITGVDTLTLTVNQTLNNQANGKLLSAGVLTLKADSVTNDGQLQGNATTITAGQLTNGGHLQGETLTLAASGGVNNRSGGVLMSRNALNVSTATLSNQGTIQGGGGVSLNATDRLQNDGKILSGSNLTLTAQLLANTGSGLVQAATLLLDVVNTVNGGRVLATGSADVKGTTLNNTGTLQGADLLVNYHTFSNSGTLLGTSGLGVKGSSLLQNGTGRLYSAGNLLLDAQDFSGQGQVVATGDVTLKLIAALTNHGTLAAGKTLSVTSQNAITNGGVMQGDAMVLGAGEAFTNNGMLTAGKGNSVFSAQRLFLNAPGSLQAGGDVSLNSRSDITISGFTGTAGSLTMNVAGTLLNSALIYAGNNLKLFTDRLHNQHGDILAGNSLWVQKDASGGANTEIINTSGNIETHQGDIVVRTGHLLNQREGFSATTTTRTNPSSIQGMGNALVDIPLSLLPDGSYGYFTREVENQHGTPCNGHGACNITMDTLYYYAPFADSATQRFLSSQNITTVTGADNPAGRIASGRNLSAEAERLENRASFILANGDIALSGRELSNQSWQTGTENEYLVYRYDPKTFYGSYATGSLDKLPLLSPEFENNTIRFSLDGREKDYTPGKTYYSVIQAGGDVKTRFTSSINISNISSVISGKTVQLESVSGNISNITRRQQWNAGSDSRYGGVYLSGTDTGPVATIKGTDSLSLDAGKNIDITGATVSSGGTLGMSAGNDINIAANLISGSKSQSGFWHTDDNSASSTTSQGSISAGGNLAMAAGHNLDVTASSVSAGHSALLSAGNDLSLNAVRESKNSRNGRSESHESHAAVSTVTAGDNLLLVAGRDVASQAAGVAAENNVVIRGGRDVNLVAESAGAGDSYTSKKKKEINETVRQQGTEIASGGDTTVNAGRDITAVASSVTATGNISVNAGRDVALTTATESDYHYLETKKKSGGFLSKKTTRTISEDSATREAGSLLSGNRVTVNAGDNLTVEGSDVVADQDVSLAAGNHVDVLAATSTDTSWRFKETKKSGLMGTGGIGFTIGSSKTTHDRREAGTTQSQSASTIGSTAGNVSITAGKQAHISGSDVIANRDISITGDSVVVDPGHDRRTVDEKFEQKKSGLTVALSGTVGSAINNAVTSAQETKESSDSRLKALQATKTALSGVQAGQAATMASATGDPNATGVSLSLTTQKSKSQQHSESDTVSGSTLNAGNNLSVVATGKNRGDNRGDIVIAGSQLKAGGNTSLDAANDILLSGAANTQKTTGRNSSSGGGVGVSIGAGKGAGISAFASVNAAKGREKGNGTEWTETTTDSGKTVTINSGRDTVLNGAQVNGNRIIADVGHDLLISSQQDTSKYDSKQTSVAAGGSFTFGSMTGSGYIAASRDKMKSRFDSVAEQTGMFAGDGGFDITVGRHTQLDGAVIASTATPDKNHLDTGTLGFSDLHNEADYKVSHSGISLSGGGSFGDKFQGNMPGGMISAGGHSGHAEGTTQAAVAEGIITIRDRDNQKQNLANLSRDPAHANDSISPIFDKEKEQRRLQTVGLISDIGSQVADIARTQGELNALKAAQDKYGPVPADATEEQRQAYLAKLRDTPEYKKEQEKYGTGSDMQRGIQAATAALQGLVGGNMAGALAGASAPELANIIGHHAGIDDNTAAKAIAHAILGGVTAALQGNSAAAGAIGASTGEVIASAIAKSLYPGVDPSKLTEDQKQTVSTLATLSAGMAGGIASGDVAGAAAGAGAGKNVVENNALSLVARGCAVAAPCRTKVAEQLLEIGAKAGMAGLAGAAVKDMADRMTSDELEHLITLQMMGNDEITTKYLSSLHDKYGSGAASNPNIGKDLTDAEKVELGGSGSGTGTPPPSENDPKQQNEKPVDKLNQKQESAIKKIDNTIKNALKDHDIIGTLKDMDGKPVPKENGGYWDHMQEMQNTLRGLRNHADTLKNVNNPEAQAAYGRATDAINKIESALKGYGI
ncbi:TPA: contact-dependent inhibition effector tRNA nuclease [Escherichia coli]|uniref:contact-dependent inhibition effector tRNA nuclease n=1 Tax=Escherichia coli TaxID=562 RepID=UPI00201898C5|nr:contact-dependent inhibition effector tRNA nuclease [Escherichia coli]MCL3979199.1 contact-dependent inhibition effector tRNA nuclease [Escherichia coli]HDS3058117.1 contact-dependent inhibition effector tRNA nuclease [Escherichia coli]HDT2925189.1 contact-dependent inhibition effector tRNA nuclease [Escherichia coli]HDV7553068.1 contact-dependent inhibition effector tRNA nuclease [Escherichia coli]HDV7582982.1 contact-dependent inhibition effector tRNA nuclease [Escherichia coli]